MFSLSIIDSDAFLDMPASSQLLYFHLSMRADDEGFIGNPKKIARIIGASDDDMKVLIAKRFLLSFESGVIVIKHWLMHNTIRMDRFGGTAYTEEKALITTKENRAYTLVIPDGNQLATIRQPDDRHLATQVKISKVKISKNTSSPDGDGGYSESFEDFWKSYPRKVGKGNAWKAWQKLKPTKVLCEKMLASVTEHAQKDPQWKKDNGQYIPHPATFINQRRFEDEISETATRGADRFTEKEPF